jgi:hypothetical protein
MSFAACSRLAEPPTDLIRTVRRASNARCGVEVAKEALPTIQLRRRRVNGA